jgi:hypothetical protein
MSGQGFRLVTKLVVLVVALSPLVPGAIRNLVRRREVALQALAGLAFLALTFWVATGIDAGRYAGQSHAGRTAMVAGILVSGAIGVILLVNIFFIGDGEPRLPLRTTLWVSLGVLGIVALVELGWFLERSYGVYHVRFPLAALGVAVAALTLLRPWWFWSHPKAMFFRDLVGDAGTTVVYLVIAGVMTWSAIMLPGSPGDRHGARAPGFTGTMTECFEFEPGPAARYGFNTSLGLQAGYETGFALWMPAIPPSTAMRDTTTTNTAYEGTWHRRGGDSLEFRIRRDGYDTWARLTLAPGDPIRVGMIEADPSVFGTSAASELKILPVRARRSECRVQVRAGPPPRG